MINKIKSGFTLVETLIAVLVLSVSLAGPLTLASRSIGVVLLAKDQLSASYLAQDAMEYLRFRRDSACLASGSPCPTANWLSSLSNCIAPNLCTLDSTETDAGYTNGPVVCPSGLCPALNFDPAIKRYTYASGGTAAPTIFTRITSLTTPVGGSADEALASTTVYWSDQGGIVRSINVRENLLNLQ